MLHLKVLLIYLVWTHFCKKWNIFQNFQHLRFPNSKNNSSTAEEPEINCTCAAGKKKKKKKNPDEADDGHLVSSCLVVLAIVGYLPDGTCIPVFVNPFRNSYLGIKPLKYKVSRFTWIFFMIWFNELDRAYVLSHKLHL